MGRHSYKNTDIEFVKVTVEIEKDLYEKLKNISNDYFDRRSTKEIINHAIQKYLEM